MNKRKLLTLALTLCMIAILAIGGTLAYFMDTDSEKNVFTVGNVTITQNEYERVKDADGNFTDELKVFEDNKQIVPAVGTFAYEALASQGYDKTAMEGNWNPWSAFTSDLKNVHDKFITVTNTGKSPAYVRTIVALEDPTLTGNAQGGLAISHNEGHKDKNNEIKTAVYENVEVKGVNYSVFIYTYQQPVAAGATTVPSFRQVYMTKDSNNEYAALFGDTFEILALSQAIQSDGFATADAAFAEGYEAVDNDQLAAWLEAVA